MPDSTTDSLAFPSPEALAAADPLTDILRQGAQRLLTQAIEAEVEQWIAEHAELIDERGHRQVVRNGHLPMRSIVTGVGPVEVTQPRIHDRRSPVEGQEKFTSSILPPYLRKTKSIEELIPIADGQRPQRRRAR